ncbi:MAG: hypothetical protein EOP47_17365 [Sphingobacteriaceae bacterium]|nr:MAG: hypothetical protein EOP47_17365 [Sphingobacteriaceae bacterium]
MNFLKRATTSIITILLFFACKTNNGNQPGPGDNTVTPVAKFNWTGTQRINADIQFVNDSKNADSYKWDFGNGETSTKQTPDKIKYATESTYDVILTAIKGDRRAIYKQTLAIAADNLPLAHFSYTYKDQRTYIPATVTFNNESVNALSYKWVINGNNYYDTHPTVTFYKAGTFTVKLTGINGNEEATYTDEVTITANNNPQAGFVLAYHPFPYTVNEAIQLVNQSKNADAWEWTFGTNGPAPSTAEHPEIKFAVAGTYTIMLIAKKGNLTSAPKTINLKINP